jgi:protein-disulfide isomerase
MTHTIYSQTKTVTKKALKLGTMLAFAGFLSACGSGEDSASGANSGNTGTTQGSAHAAPVDAPEIAMGDMILGNSASPVTIIEYASMTCSHCASFHKHTYPRLKENYIDTGKIQFVFREFPLDTYALEASIMARCAGEERYFDVVSGLFERQEEWILPRTASKIRAAMRGIGADLGVTREMNEACQDNEAVQKRIAAKRNEAVNRYKVTGTPALVINGKLFEQGVGYNNVARHIEELLAANQ